LLLHSRFKNELDEFFKLRVFGCDVFVPRKRVTSRYRRSLLVKSLGDHQF
jgi:hypothetical protein